MDSRIKETYVRDSTATNRNALSDAYVRFFRWATDRLQGRDGIVCLVTNNSFVDQLAFDGMRKHLLQDFTRVYHVDLHGNVRKNPKLSGTAHNVFGIQVGVGITIAVRSSAHDSRSLLYHRVPEDWRKERKLTWLGQQGSIQGISWQELEPDSTYNWLTDGMRPEFSQFVPTSTKAAKAQFASSGDAPAIFGMYSSGVKTNRDDWVYDFDAGQLARRIVESVDTYNGEIDRWARAGQPDNIDEFVRYESARIKWSCDLKADLKRKRYAQYTQTKVRTALYRPFTKRWYFLDPILSQDIFQQPLFFPTPHSERENVAIGLTGVGSEKPFMALAVNAVSDFHLTGAGASTQCFPLYTYDEDGSNRRENVTDWALAQFRARYGDDVSKRDIFDYVYGLLHHPQYRERYAENLKRELPRNPLLPSRADYDAVRATGAALAALHLGYETWPEYKLAWRFNNDVPMNWRVTKMKLTPDKRAVVYNEWLTLEGIPPEAFEYRLGNRSALEWVVDQYQVSTDGRSGITSDPNRDGSDDEQQYIARLVGRVTNVSVETVRLVNEMAAHVDMLAALGIAAAVTA